MFVAEGLNRASGVSQRCLRDALDKPGVFKGTSEAVLRHFLGITEWLSTAS